MRDNVVWALGDQAIVSLGAFAAVYHAVRSEYLLIPARSRF